jgi:hypothetical protein
MGIVIEPDCWAEDRGPEDHDYRRSTRTDGCDDEGPAGDGCGDTAGGDAGDSNWPDPRPIVGELRPVPVFDAATLLPSAVRAWVLDEADRMRCPGEFVAVATLVLIGSIIGTRCALKPKQNDSWVVVPNLWGALVGEPSSMKTPAMSTAQTPLDRLIARAKAAHKEAFARHETDQAVYVAKKRALETKMKAAAGKDNDAELRRRAEQLRELTEATPPAPAARRYKTNDSTIEKLGELLCENRTGILVLRDELVGLLASWDREGREGERAFFLEGWNGTKSFDTDRIGRGHVDIPNLCLSIFGGIQPDKLVVYLEQASSALANDGMLQRFQMLVFPDETAWTWIDRKPDIVARDVVFEIFERIADVDPIEFGATPANEYDHFPHFLFGDEAQQVFIEWSSDLRGHRIPSEDDALIRQHLGKYDKLMASLALIFHIIECVQGTSSGLIAKAPALMAAAWCEFLESHARRSYGLLTDGGLRAAKLLATKIEKGKLQDGFTLRDLRRHKWSGLREDSAILSAVECLEDADWIVGKETGGTGPGSGRATTRYHINPKARRSRS